MDWNKFVSSLRDSFQIHARKPLSSEMVIEAFRTLDASSCGINGLYLACNGFTGEWLNLLPIENPRDVTRTWNGLRLANDPMKSRYLNKHIELLPRFLIFADIGNGCAAAIDRNDGSVWYEEDNELHQTDLSLPDFLVTCLREERDTPEERKGQSTF